MNHPHAAQLNVHRVSVLDIKTEYADNDNMGVVHEDFKMEEEEYNSENASNNK